MQTVDTLNQITDLIAAALPAAGRVELHTTVATRLSKVVKRVKPWGWRYIQGVSKGTIKPSKELSKAVDKLAYSMDDKSPELVDIEYVTVAAPRGKVQSRAYLSAASRLCENPACNITFIPRVPWQKYCGLCKRRRK